MKEYFIVRPHATDPGRLDRVVCLIVYRFSHEVLYFAFTPDATIEVFTERHPKDFGAADVAERIINYMHAAYVALRPSGIAPAGTADMIDDFVKCIVHYDHAKPPGDYIELPR
jgi:hypothetical protein